MQELKEHLDFIQNFREKIKEQEIENIKSGMYKVQTQQEKNISLAEEISKKFYIPFYKDRNFWVDILILSGTIALFIKG